MLQRGPGAAGPASRQLIRIAGDAKSAPADAQQQAKGLGATIREALVHLVWSERLPAPAQ